MNMSTNYPLLNCDTVGYKKPLATVKAAGTTGTWLVSHLYLRRVLRAARHAAIVTAALRGFMETTEGQARPSKSLLLPANRFLLLIKKERKGKKCDLHRLMSVVKL